MKKTILAMAVVLVSGLTSAFANKTDAIDQRITASFHRDFEMAKNVSWQQENNYVKATFSLNEHILYAYYSKEGDLLALVRNVLSDHLPVVLQVELKKTYGGYWITDLFELSSDTQTTYYCSLESENEILILQSDGHAHWSVYKRIKKNTA
ncbi:MAG TPA: hypothetical protein VMI35_07645 [Puia sp.]|nr:hypothetical protein [Puia sp.]